MKRRLGHRHTEGRPAETQGEGGQLYTEERGLQGSQPCLHVDFGLLASRNGRQQMFIVEAAWCVAAPGNCCRG